MTQPVERAQQRWRRIQEQLPVAPEVVRKEVDALAVGIETRLQELSTAGEPGGHDRHPLTRAPFLMTDLLFMLDRCEILLETSSGSLQPLAEPPGVPYPGLTRSAFRRAVSLLVRLRGWIRKYPVRYPVPAVSSAAWPHAPRFISRVLRRLALRRKAPAEAPRSHRTTRRMPRLSTSRRQLPSNSGRTSAAD